MVQHGRDDPAVVEWRQKSGLIKNKIKKQKPPTDPFKGHLKNIIFFVAVLALSGQTITVCV